MKYKQKIMKKENYEAGDVANSKRVIPKFKEGNKAFFTYKCLESEESQDAELWHHTKQNIVILKKLGKDVVDEEEVGFMYRVRFDDAFEYDVFEDELRRQKA